MEKSDYTFDFLKTLSEAGLHTKIDVTETLKGYYPSEKYKYDGILNQEQAITHFLDELKGPKLIKYDTFLNDAFEIRPYIEKWYASITSKGMLLYLDYCRTFEKKSDFSNSSKQDNPDEGKNNVNETSKNKTSVLEKISWAAGIIAVLVAIATLLYEMFKKY